MDMDQGHKTTIMPLAEEVPVSLTFNGVASAVMMMTPHDIEDFVVGFSLTEGIVDQASDVSSVEVREIFTEENMGGLLAGTQIPEACFERLSGRRRNLPGQTSCGICGVIELEAAIPQLPRLEAPAMVTASLISSAREDLRNHQPLNDITGALHAAAFVDETGIVLVREDVGRHNALDKLIGAMARKGLDPAAGFYLLSSRCSVELVQKTVLAGCPALVTISAATTLAADRARKSGLTLISSVRKGDFAVISDPQNVITNSGEA